MYAGGNGLHNLCFSCRPFPLISATPFESKSTLGDAIAANFERETCRPMSYRSLSISHRRIEPSTRLIFRDTSRRVERCALNITTAKFALPVKYER